MTERLFVCGRCGYEDRYDTDLETLECPFCRDGTLKLVAEDDKP